MPLFPKHSAAGIEEALQIDHGRDTVEEKANEVWNRNVGDTVGWEICYLPYPSTKEREAYLSTSSDGPFS